MFKEALNQIKTAILVALVFTFLLGFIYPLVVTGFAQLLFPNRANGSLITDNGKLVGSRLIGQEFTSPIYFWSRPSATTPYAYNGGASNASNLGPSNPDLLNQIKDRLTQLKKTNPQNTQTVPIDLLTSSGSGLDPEISPLAAFYQVPRIAKERQLSELEVYNLIRQYQTNRTWGFLGEPRVNVLELNLALDRLRTVNGQNTPRP